MKLFEITWDASMILMFATGEDDVLFQLSNLKEPFQIVSDIVYYNWPKGDTSRVNINEVEQKRGVISRT